MTVICHFRKVHPSARAPENNRDGDAGYDICSTAEVRIPPNKWGLVPTGLHMQFPPDCYARIAPRSGLALKHGIDVLAGVCDSSYRAEYKVILMNHGSEEFCVNPGDRIAQIVFERICKPKMVLVDDLDASERGEAGFGSSGVM